MKQALCPDVYRTTPLRVGITLHSRSGLAPQAPGDAQDREARHDAGDGTDDDVENPFSRGCLGLGHAVRENRAVARSAARTAKLANLFGPQAAAGRCVARGQVPFRPLATIIDNCRRLSRGADIDSIIIGTVGLDPAFAIDEVVRHDGAGHTAVSGRAAVARGGRAAVSVLGRVVSITDEVLIHNPPHP